MREIDDYFAVGLGVDPSESYSDKLYHFANVDFAKRFLAKSPYRLSLRRHQTNLDVAL